LGQHQEAISQVDRFKQLDPVSPKTHVAAATIYYAAGEYKRAIAAARDALELEGQSEPAHYLLGMAHHFAGHRDASIDLLTESSRNCAPLLSGLAFVLGQNGRADAAWQLIDQMQERATANVELSPYDFAEAFIGVGEIGRTLEYLNRACELRLSEMVGVAVDPVFKSLHDHPGFRRMLRTVGLDSAARAAESR
jgi:tetratricopeptide (TPR) repeat protein